ncbi:MAG: ATP synthase F0 subunit C [Lachnospiraceae bacterium]|jgi:F-type H+-transporting ATPase subunit c
MKTMMKSVMKKVSVFAILALMMMALAAPVFAEDSTSETTAAEETVTVEETEEDSSTGTKAVSAAIAIAVASGVGAAAMGVSISKSAESTARQPEAGGQIRTSLMLGLVFIETAIIYALIVAILIIFVL